MNISGLSLERCAIAGPRQYSINECYLLDIRFQSPSRLTATEKVLDEKRSGKNGIIGKVFLKDRI